MRAWRLPSATFAPVSNRLVECAFRSADEAVVVGFAHFAGDVAVSFRSVFAGEDFLLGIPL